MFGLNTKSVIVGAVGFWVLLKFVAPRVPALNALRP